MKPNCFGKLNLIASFILIGRTNSVWVHLIRPSMEVSLDVHAESCTDSTEIDDVFMHVTRNGENVSYDCVSTQINSLGKSINKQQRQISELAFSPK